MLIVEYNNIVFADTYKLRWLPLSYLFTRWWLTQCVIALHPAQWIGCNLDDNGFNYLPDLQDDSDYEKNWFIGFLVFIGYYKKVRNER